MTVAGGNDVAGEVPPHTRREKAIAFRQGR